MHLGLSCALIDRSKEKVSKHFVILSEAKNLSFFSRSKSREILRFAQNDKMNATFRSLVKPNS